MSVFQDVARQHRRHDQSDLSKTRHGLAARWPCRHPFKKRKNMSQQINLDRRRFFGAAAGTLAAAQLFLTGPAGAQSGNAKPATAVKPGTQYVVSRAEADQRRRPQCRLRRSRTRRRSPGHSAARLALRHSRLRRCRPDPGLGRLPGDRAASARLRHHALSFPRHAAERPAGRARGRRHRPDGCAQNREGCHRRVRLGRADGRHRCGDLAAARQGAGLGERLSDRQPAAQQGAAAAKGRAFLVVPVLFRHRARPGRLRKIHAGLCPADLAARLRRNGISTTPRSTAARLPSTIPIMSRFRSTIIAGGSAWPRARRNTTIWRSGLRHSR